jgi:cytidine deaminase
MVRVMNTDLSADEQRLLTYAQDAVTRYNSMRHGRGGIDTLYSFLLSDGDQIFDGAAFEPNIAHSTFCGERCAIANMVLQESYEAKIRTIVIADPVPSIQNRSTPPCGTCRHVIHQFATTDTTVLSVQYIQQQDGWEFLKVEKWTIDELYPHPYEPVKGLWDSAQPHEYKQVLNPNH